MVQHRNISSEEYLNSSTLTFNYTTILHLMVGNLRNEYIFVDSKLNLQNFELKAVPIFRELEAFLIWSAFEIHELDNKARV